MAGGEFAVRRSELVRAATQPVAVASQGAQRSPSMGGLPGYEFNLVASTNGSSALVA